MRFNYVTFFKVIIYVLNQVFIALIRAKSVGVRGLVLDEHRRILLIQHTYKPGWHMPGGGVNYNEHPIDALKRELREEACIEVIEHSPELVGIFHQRYFGHDDYPIMYAVNQFKILRNVKPDFEIADIKWCPLDELASVATQETYQHVQNYLNNRPPNKDWCTKNP